MINNYEIRKINGENILYLYINNNYEFAKISKIKKRRKNFLKNITDFIQKNEIKFAGSTIALVAGGLVIGNVFFNRNDDINLKNSIISIHINPDITETENAKKEFLETTNINTDIDEIIDTKVVINEVVKKDKISSEKEEIIEIEKKETITVFRNNGEILNLELEDYLINVVAAEMPASFNVEALKAQSVLARTYAKVAINNGKSVTDTVSTQVYKDNKELTDLWGTNFKKYYEKIKKAVNDTEGEVLKYNGDLIQVVYHAISNGYTEDAKNVWQNSLPYLKVVESPWDKFVKNYEVKTFFSYESLSNMLGFTVNNKTEFKILNKNSSNRVTEICVDNNSYTGTNFRNLLSLRSTDFNFEIVDNGINIITKGYGHGVGMSQYGANEMAKLGYSYQDILKYYYESTSLVKE